MGDSVPRLLRRPAVLVATLIVVAVGGSVAAYANLRSAETECERIARETVEQHPDIDPDMVMVSCGPALTRRVVADGGDTDVPEGWSPWCEFTVSADAPDYRKLGEVPLELLRELGLRPDRSYTVAVTAGERRVLRESTFAFTAAERRALTGASLTLTGPRWADLLSMVGQEAQARDEWNDSDLPPPGGGAYWKVLDSLSVKLGGPAHPSVGVER